MEISYEIVPIDLTHYGKEAAKSSSVYMLQTIVIVSISILFMMSDMILAVVAVFMNDGSINVQSFHLIPRLIIALAISGISYFSLMTYSKYLGRKALRDSTGKNGLFCEHTISLEGQGFTETTEVNKSFYAWTGVENISETKSFVLINIRLGPRFMVPKRAFADDERIREFVLTASSYIDAAKVPPPVLS